AVMVVHQLVGRVSNFCCFTHGVILFSSCQRVNVPDFLFRCPVVGKIAYDQAPDMTATMEWLSNETDPPDRHGRR
ncbi:hypothetical protein, partial [Pseudomonas syringae group genomosp. 3]|uniref:hypothetical protein n=1 Tax=Pseudomonas syringae group genomosp. 3 TaxID=251701 RepID=UPI001C0F98E0